MVTGSIATDCLMRFPGRFADQFVGDRLDRVSLSFLVDELEIRRGGVAANIAYGLAQLGLRPVLVGAVGKDFGEYRRWLDSHGVDTGSVLVAEELHTARFLCTTDSDHNQIASFHAGAMSRARDIALAPMLRTGADLVVISPNDPEAMLRHTRDCRESGIPFVADPSQQLAYVNGTQMRALIEGATWLFTNEYERELLLAGIGCTAEDVLSRVGSWVTTLGADGVRVESRGTEPIVVKAVTVEVVDPTGAGDAFRAGFLAGVEAGMGTARSAQLGCVAASFALESPGPQSYTIALTSLLSRLGAAYGHDAEIELAARVRPVRER
ncbi:carbohydrate kinase family protein [Kutzneria sp. CA-103260]|nr:carbohydrate kinase family protein [Kutzneria sp. CA-103260]